MRQSCFWWDPEAWNRRRLDTEEIPYYYFCYRVTSGIVAARNSTTLITHNWGSKASQRSHSDVTDHRWLTAEAWPQSPPGLSGFCRGNTGSSKGRHSGAQRVASRSPWTWEAPRWPACEQRHEKGVRQWETYFPGETKGAWRRCWLLPRWIRGGIDWCKIILVDLWAPDDFWYCVDGLKGEEETLSRNLWPQAQRYGKQLKCII